MSGDMMVSNTTSYNTANVASSVSFANSEKIAELRQQENAAKTARVEYFAELAKDVVSVSEAGDTVSVSEEAKKQVGVLIDNADGVVAKKEQPELYDLIGYTREQIKGFYIEGRITRYDYEKDDEKRDALAKQLSREEYKAKAKEANREQILSQIENSQSDEKKVAETKLEEKRIINSKVEKAMQERRILESRTESKVEEKEMEVRREQMSKKFAEQRKALDKDASAKVQSSVEENNKIVQIQRRNEVSNGLMNRHSQEEGILWDFQLEA